MLASLALPAHAIGGTLLADLASSTAGRTVAVHCMPEASSASEAWTILAPDPAGTITAPGLPGTYSVGPDIWLKNRLCRALVPLVYHRLHGAQATHEAAYALANLTHEAMHIRLQSRDEGLVECIAFQNYWPAIARVHLAPALAGGVLREARWVHNYDLPRWIKDAAGNTIANPYRAAC